MSKYNWLRVISVSMVGALVWSYPYNFLKGAFIGYALMLIVIKFEEN